MRAYLRIGVLSLLSGLQVEHDLLDQGVYTGTLGDEISGSQFLQLFYALPARQYGIYYDWNYTGAIVLLQSFQDTYTAAAGHMDIQNDQVRVDSLRNLHSISGIQAEVGL